MVLMCLSVCLFVCLSVCLSPLQKPGPLGTFWIPWTLVERLDAEIRAYRDQGKDGQLLRLKEENIELEKKLTEMKQPAALSGHLGR